MFLGISPTEGPKFNPLGKASEEEIRQGEIQNIIDSGYRIKAPQIIAAENLYEQGYSFDEVINTPLLNNVHRISVGNHLRNLEQGIVRVER